MARANSTINIAELDFDSIKYNFKQYLKGQDNFNDYDFEGSVISSVLDILAYNTHYNAYYLNMVANEMFLDTSIKRGSVVSHAKLLNYVPTSTKASKALIDIKFNGTTSPNFTIPKYTKFYSEAIDNTNYAFVTLESASVTTSNSSAQFYSIPIYQGQPVRYSFNVDLASNPSLTFKLPDSEIDLSTLSVLVYRNQASTVYDIYNISTSHLKLNSTTQVYFTQEAIDGSYEIYFGDGILGKTLSQGNVVIVEYLTTKAGVPNGASTFTLMDDIGNYTGTIINIVQVAAGGKDKESVSSIKYNAPKAYAAQNRAITKSDYIQLLENDNSIIPIEAVNVWGGEEVTPPQYGKMFICIKPKGGYSITTSQKFRLINELIKPFSVITVVPEIVDIDYTFIKISTNVLYNKSLTTFSPTQLINLIKLQIVAFCNAILNSFDSTFILPNLITTINKTDASIITSESSIQLQKRFLPIFNSSNSKTFNFETAIKKNSISSSYYNYINPLNSAIISNVSIEEAPAIFNVIESVQILTAGAGYTSTPTVSIYGDGTGALAVADIINGALHSITVTNPGSGYTQAVAVVTGGGGSGATVVPNLSGNIATLRSFYFSNGIKTILQTDIGKVNHSEGTIEIYEFTPYTMEDPLGIMSISIIPESSIFYSTRDKMITLDIMDDSAVTVNLNSK
jgi:hypothetical protein